MSRKPNDTDVDDRTRILMHLIGDLHFASCFPNDPNAVRFESVEPSQLRPGNLVMCQTSGIHPWTIAKVVAYAHGPGAYLRELGTSNTAYFKNESFLRIIGMLPEHLLEDQQFKFLVKVRKAFQKTKSVWHRYKRIEFPEQGLAVVTFVPHSGEPVEMHARMNQYRKMSIGNILGSLRLAGFDQKPRTVNDDKS